MKTILFLLLLVLPCTARELVWFDEFNGDELDVKKWSINEGKRNDAINCKESISVKNGCLQIKVFSKDGIHYTGVIDTEGKFEVAYGYWEMRVKFNDQDATWSDGWLYTQSAAKESDNIHKAGMEVDIFEHRKTDMNNKDIRGVVNHGLCWNGYGENRKMLQTDKPLNKDEWHVIGLEWTKDSYKWYVDGKQSWEATPTTSKPLFFIFSTEVGFINSWTQPLLKEYNHTTMWIDYVRYYKITDTRKN